MHNCFDEVASGGEVRMKPTKCRECEGVEFLHSHLTANVGSGVFVRRGAFGEVPVLCSICLNCGALYPYVDRSGLTTVRAWHAKETHGQ
jgi:hypothetical protein